VSERRIHRRILCIAALLALGCPASAQSVDAAVQVKEGMSFNADIEVGLITGFAGALQDETWFVTGACSNRPSVSVAIKIGFSASLQNRTVGLSRSRFTADKVVCITNANDLSKDMLEALGIENEGD